MIYSSFPEKKDERTQSLDFSSNLTTLSPLKMAEMEKTISSTGGVGVGGWGGGGLQPLGYPNMSKSRLYLLSFFLEKHDYFFVIFGLDFQIWLLFLVLRLYFWKK